MIRACGWLICLSSCGAAIPSLAQINRDHVQGGATPYVLSSDYRALGINPSLLTCSPWEGDYLRAVGGVEGGVSLRSQIFDSQSIWDQILGRVAESSDPWTLTSWRDALTEEELSLNASFLNAAFARRFGQWGLGYASRSGANAIVQLGPETAQLLSDGGLALYSEIEVSGTGSVVSTSDYDPSIGESWQGVTLNADVQLAQLLEGTRLKFESLQSHELAISRGFGDVISGWSLHVGLGARVLLGQSLFEFDTRGERSVAFATSNQRGGILGALQGLDSLGGYQQLLAGINVGNAPGMGWGGDVGLTLSSGERMWLTASLVDLGQMTWKGREYYIEDIQLEETLFGSSNAAINPDEWLSGVVDLLDPETWFDSDTEATRTITTQPMLAIGAGIRPLPWVTVAGNMTLRSRDALSNGGWAGGVTAGVSLLQRFKIETGIRQIPSFGLSIPMGLRYQTLGGIEWGLRLGDISALRHGSQSGIAVHTCFLRYRLSPPR